MIDFSLITYRILVLGKQPSDIDNEFADVFWVSDDKSPNIRPNQLQVKQDNSTTVMADLEEEVRKREWKAAVEREFMGREVSEALRIATRDSPEVAIRWLRDLESRAAMSEDRILSGITRTLLAKAGLILERKTIVCLPSEGDAWCRIANRIANEVYEHLRLGDLRWTFTQLQPDNKPTRAERSKKTPIATLLEALQMKVAGAPLKSLPPKKLGPTLLVGETGTGKSMAALLFSTLSGRTNFHRINLSAVSSELLESRLRGSKKGAFTGSVEDRKGWFEHADDGILFLDEVQSAPIEFQTQLLDLLDPSTNEVSVARIGDDDNRKIFETKVILAINEEIETLIAEKRLRNDIFFRIRNIVRLPALRKRLADDAHGHLMRVLLSVYRWKSAMHVAASELESMATDRKASLFPNFIVSAYEQLRGHAWPGNLREFERVANDLYWDLDEGPERSIDGEDVRRAIDIFKVGVVQAQPSSQDAIDQRVLADVQAALRDENFVLKNAKERLSRYKLSGYESLKRYLRENQDRLDSDVLADSKIKRVLAKSSPTIAPDDSHHS